MSTMGVNLFTNCKYEVAGSNCVKLLMAAVPPVGKLLAKGAIWSSRADGINEVEDREATTWPKGFDTAAGGIDAILLIPDILYRHKTPALLYMRKNITTWN